jgi:hypothetical protein
MGYRQDIQLHEMGYRHVIHLHEMGYSIDMSYSYMRWVIDISYSYMRWVIDMSSIRCYLRSSWEAFKHHMNCLCIRWVLIQCSMYG